MKFDVQSKSMMLLLPLLAACSGDGSADPVSAATQQLDTAVAAQGVKQPAKAVTPLTDFDIWAQRMMADRLSPVAAAAGDLSETWVGADGKQSSVVVRAPRTAGKPTVTIALPASGTDATPIFKTAIDQLRRQGGGILKVAPGEYRFRSSSMEQPGLAHIMLYRVADVDIQAHGATFVFEKTVDGIFIQDSQRVRISGATLRDSKVLGGMGRMRMVNGAMRLELDEPAPAGAAASWVQAVNEDGRTFPQVTARAIFPAGATPAARVSDKIYTAPEFKTLKDGQRVAVRFSWYGARAIYVRDSYAGTGEDVTINAMRVTSTAGMGIAIKTRGRGIAIVNSTLAAEPGRPHSTNYDGIHLVAAAGDILLRGNSLANTGDDPVNLRSPIHKVTAAGTNQATLDNDARLIRVGDEVAFFNKSGEYLSRRIVASAPPIGHTDTIAFGFKPGEPIKEAAFARVVNLTPRRFAIMGNTFADGAGRGMLVQIANGIIQNNVIRNFPRTAIRMLTSFDPWYEGAGAINVRVTNNTIENGAAEVGTSYVPGIITAMGEVIAMKVGPGLYNGPLRIENNKFVAPRAACIAIYNTKAAVQQNNACGT